MTTTQMILADTEIGKAVGMEIYQMAELLEQASRAFKFIESIGSDWSDIVSARTQAEQWLADFERFQKGE